MRLLKDEVPAIGGGLGLSSIKLRWRLAGGDANLLAVFYGDDGMAAARLGDIAQDGDDLAAQVGEVANFGAVASGDYRLKRAFVARAEREMSIAALANGDPKDFSRNTSVIADQLRCVRKQECTRLGVSATGSQAAAPVPGWWE